MAHYPDSIEKLINELIKFPGIGRRSAERIITYILNTNNKEVQDLADALVKVKNSVHFCRVCHNLSEEETCAICQDVRRSRDMLCVVEKPGDVASLEKAGAFRGLYHVLLGSIAPLEGKGPQDLRIDSLLKRITAENIKEVIIATDSDTEGEATSLYLTKVLKPTGVAVSRIGIGLPVGSNLEYADPATLSMALESRRPL